MDATLEAKKRDGRGKNEARRLRAAGRVPAVVYGARKAGQAPEGVPVAVDPKEVLRILHSESGANTLINLKLDGGESRVMVRDYQLDPVSHALLHADFYQLAMDRAMVVTVPIVIKGESAGVKQQGGLLDFVTRDIQVQCLPVDIPERIEVDVTELMLHQSVRVPRPAGQPQVEAGDRRRYDARARRRAQGRRGGDAGGRSGGRARRRGGRARGYQEGQDRQGRGSAEEVVKLIVGLGNPGREYRDTRHNVGFMVVDEIARRHTLVLALGPSQVPEAMIAKRHGAEPLFVAKPLTFMNRSGDAVAGLARYYGIDPAGRAGRPRRGGAAVRSAPRTAARIGRRTQRSQVGHRSTRDLGICPGFGWGLGAATRDAISRITCSRSSRLTSSQTSKTFIARAADAAEMFATAGIEKVMNMYNPGAVDPD